MSSVSRVCGFFLMDVGLFEGCVSLFIEFMVSLQGCESLGRVCGFLLRDVGRFEGCVSLFIEFMVFFSGMWISWKGL